MKRLQINERNNWKETVESQGLIFHSTEGKYWDESACYAFTEKEILELEKATNELYEMCIEATDFVISRGLYKEFGIPEKYISGIEHSWNNEFPSIYGRFDLAFDGKNVKMLEFNADTPTALLEASVIQWHWLLDYYASADQFNSIHEHLIEHFKVLKPYFLSDSLHFTCVEESIEDYMTTAYLMDCASQTGYKTNLLYISDISYDEELNAFLDIENKEIKNIFKLYPYDWMMHEDFGEYLLTTMHKMYWVEPMWKSIPNNKMILKILWDLYPHHPYLLPTHTSPVTKSYVKKPLISREGNNIEIFHDGKIIAQTDGEYGEEGFIYQEYFEIPSFDGHVPTIGSWLIGENACGIGIRENTSRIVDNFSRFVPHYFI
ncbi:glutathionylspermidine synthase [bacterium 336/3]|nr:glutathionylspermidine synthase [bacterium 336/3]